MSTNLATLQSAADDVVNDAIRAAIHGSDPIIIVDSPPGAGKTFLVECACAVALDQPQLRVAVITPNVAQAYDIAERLTSFESINLTVMHAKHRTLPPALAGNVRELKGWDSTVTATPGVLVANVHVLAQRIQMLATHEFDLLILDEAYQLDSSNFLSVSPLAPRILMVGDPGQLAPVQQIDTANLEAAEHKMHRPAPAYVLDRFPDTPVCSLPATRRLTADTTSYVQPAFYPNLPFQSVVDNQDRRLGFTAAGIASPIDKALDAVASGASLISLTLPGNAPPHQEVDLELAELGARVVDRIIQRQAAWIGQDALSEDDIGCIDPHIVSGGAWAQKLRSYARDGVEVDTVERWQGRQKPIMLVRHPLSTVGRPTGFELERGRWCVSLSRHLLGCIIIARASVEHVIKEYLHRSDSAAAGAEDTVWGGYVAHRKIWTKLKKNDRIFSM
ncbi:MAG: AAA family ATPase [Pseudomonadota bacterium]